jgi:hypothetical protein
MNTHLTISLLNRPPLIRQEKLFSGGNCIITNLLLSCGWLDCRKKGWSVF